MERVDKIKIWRILNLMVPQQKIWTSISIFYDPLHFISRMPPRVDGWSKKQCQVFPSVVNLISWVLVNSMADHSIHHIPWNILPLFYIGLCDDGFSVSDSFGFQLKCLILRLNDLYSLFGVSYYLLHKEINGAFFFTFPFYIKNYAYLYRVTETL